MSYKGSVGRRGEELAAELLEKEGYSVVARNLRIGPDELDLVVEDESCLVFVEVKTRAQTPANQRFGRPASAVDSKKQQHLIRAAEAYIRQNPPHKRVRIDVVEVYLPPVRPSTPIDLSSLLPLRITHLRNVVHK